MSQDCYSGMQTGMRNSESFKRRNSAGVVPIGREMRVHRRIEKLEQVLKVKVFPTHVITISFVGAGGRVTGTMVSSNDPALCVPYRIEDGERKHREG
jgi:translation initiation factor 6 (eIF-6)